MSVRSGEDQGDRRTAGKETGVEDKMIALAAWIRRNYGCTMIQALKTVLPAKQTVKKLEHRQLVRLMNREELLSLLGECERKNRWQRPDC